ncbi:MAG: lipid-A-disaccharide synthase [Legionellaceae bacterium]|nr:lipid-A-disaccharide synthase [Legionellaceae bacterium]
MLNNLKKPKHIVLVAGEESGDQHAAALVKQLKHIDPSLIFTAIGGKHLEAEGIDLISDLARFGVTGITEVLRHFKTIKKAFRAISTHLEKTKPDLLILIDYPGFNLRLAKFAKQKLGIQILYYVSPQLWAWKPGRIHTIKASVDHMAVIFPFEKKIYEDAAVPVSFVGHPLIKSLQKCRASAPTREALGLPENKQLLAILPGSRTHEVERHLPLLSRVAETLHTQFPDLHIVIPVAKTLSLEKIKKHWHATTVPYSLIEGGAAHVVTCSDAVVVASGTASLECALLEKPMCIIYKTGLIAYLAASVLLRVKYIGLCNLLVNRMIVPELLQYDFNHTELTQVLTDLLSSDNKNITNKMQLELKKLNQSLSEEQADCSLPELVVRLLDRKKSTQMSQNKLAS